MESGSSPLARGLQNPCFHMEKEPWIIPARAGFTSVKRVENVPDQDHPRSRGVYTTDAHLKQEGQGSSPLARGLQVVALRRIRAGLDHPRSRGGYEAQSLREGDRQWIIPARAGFTSRRRSPRRGTSDHPRSRGVYPNAALQAVRNLGSSPLARGLPSTISLTEDYGGIIPARAGFTC